MSEVERLANEKRCTPSQLALAWVPAQRRDIVPIPGTKRIHYLEDNARATEIELTKDELQRIGTALPQAAGTRYPEAGMRAVGR